MACSVLLGNNAQHHVNDSHLKVNIQMMKVNIRLHESVI